MLPLELPYSVSPESKMRVDGMHQSGIYSHNEPYGVPSAPGAADAVGPKVYHPIFSRTRISATPN